MTRNIIQRRLFFSGNVRIGLLISVTGGVHIFFFKDNTARKVRPGDLTKVIDVSNSIYSSGLAVHCNDKTLANEEAVASEETSEEDRSEVEDGEEDGVVYQTMKRICGCNSRRWE